MLLKIGMYYNYIDVSDIVSICVLISILCLIMHVLCEYALKLVFGFFCLFWDKVWIFW